MASKILRDSLIKYDIFHFKDRYNKSYKHKSYNHISILVSINTSHGVIQK